MLIVQAGERGSSTAHPRPRFSLSRFFCLGRRLLDSIKHDIVTGFLLVHSRTRGQGGFRTQALQIVSKFGVQLRSKNKRKLGHTMLVMKIPLVYGVDETCT